MDALLTPQQITTIRTNIARCGECRSRLDLAAALGRDDQDMRDRIDHLEQSARSALTIADQAKGGSR